MSMVVISELLSEHTSQNSTLHSIALPCFLTILLFGFLPLQTGLFDQWLLSSQIMMPLAAGKAEYPPLQITENPSPVCPLLDGDTLSESVIVWLPMHVLAENDRFTF